MDILFYMHRSIMGGDIKARELCILLYRNLSTFEALLLSLLKRNFFVSVYGSSLVLNLFLHLKPTIHLAPNNRQGSNSSFECCCRCRWFYDSEGSCYKSYFWLDISPLVLITHVATASMKDSKLLLLENRR